MPTSAAQRAQYRAEACGASLHLSLPRRVEVSELEKGGAAGEGKELLAEERKSRHATHHPAALSAQWRE